jgi:hypothetical protein
LEVTTQAAALKKTESKVDSLEKRMEGIEAEVQRLMDHCHGHGVSIASLTEVQQTQIIVAAERA